MNNPCKYKVSEKKVKCFMLKTVENVDKMEYLFISPTPKPLYTVGFRNYSRKAPQEVPGIHDFPSG